MRFPKIDSISTRLFLVMLAAVVPLLGLSIYHVLQERKDGILEGQAAALHQTMMAADNQRQLVNGVSVMLNAAAAGYRTLTTKPDKCTAFLADLISQEPQYDALFLLHPDSTLLCSDHSTLAWLPDPDVVGRALLTDKIMLVPIQGNGPAKVAFLTRMLGQDGKVVGVSVVLMKTYGFDSQAADLQQSNPGSEMVITDRAGLVLAHFPNAVQNQGANLPAALSAALRTGQETLRGTGLDGVERLYGISRLPYGPEGNPAFVWIGLPVSVAVATGDSILRLDLLVIGLVLLLGLVMTQASANWLIIHWLQPLITASRKLEGGDLTARTGIPGDKSEFGSLVGAFDRMAAELERSSIELAETASRYSNLFDRVPVGLYRTTTDGRILDANPALAGMLGYPSRERMQTIDAAAFFINPKDRLGWAEEIAKKGELVNYEVQMHVADGKTIWVLENARVIRDPEGGILYYEGSLQDITQRKLAEQSTLDANRQLHSVLNSITEAYLVLDNHWCFLEVNPVALRDTFGGRLLSELVGKVIWEEYPQAIDSEFYTQFQTALTQNHPVHFEAISKINGRWWEAHAYPNEDRLEIYLREITERKRAEAILQESEERYRTLIELSPDPTFVQGEGRIVFINPAGIKFFGARTADELVGKEVLKLIHPDCHAIVQSRIHDLVVRGQTVPLLEETYLRLDGTPVEVEVAAASFSYGGKPATQVILRDITERKRIDAYIRELAYHDPLTGLLNRRAYQEEMDRALSRARRIGRQLAVLFLDLDGFKDINDRYGHAAGDAVLVETADRLIRAVRLEDLVSRLGGDEFILLAEVDNEEGAVRIAARLLAVFTETIQVGSTVVAVSTSIGVSLFPTDGGDSGTMMRRADQAMYVAKREGKHRFYISGSGKEHSTE